MAAEAGTGGSPAQSEAGSADSIDYYTSDWIGRGRVEVADGALRCRGAVEAERAGCAAAVIFALLGLVFGGKFVFDDLGIEVAGRKTGAMSVVIFAAIVLLPAWIGYALVNRLLTKNIDRTFPLDQLRQSSNTLQGRHAFAVPAADGEPERTLYLTGNGPQSWAAAKALWEAAPPPLGAPPVRPPGTFELDGEGVRRWLEGGRCESVRWDRLIHVGVMTTADGPFGPDLFWVLAGEDETGCVIPSQAGIAEALLERVQRLPGFDNETLIAAMSSTEEARFPLWSKG